MDVVLDRLCTCRVHLSQLCTLCTTVTESAVHRCETLVSVREGMSLTEKSLVGL